MTWLIVVIGVVLAAAAREYVRWRGRRWRASGPRGDQRDERDQRDPGQERNDSD